MHLAEILRPFWKDGSFTDEARRAMYGISSDELTLADGMEQADLAVLPWSWNHYLAEGGLDQAKRFIDHTRRARKPVLRYVGGGRRGGAPAGI